RGQKTMPVYVIIDIGVMDQGLYAEYVARVPAVVEQYRGRYLVRGGEGWPWPGTGTPNGSWCWNSNPAIRRRNILPRRRIWPWPPSGKNPSLPGLLSSRVMNMICEESFQN
ncbi:MAG: DUF1330 domain-containing protein, partial [Proteobacteria bacterium]|nr:DUF1330 domain-containing protein [Pseudomonadota bacterium]